jgi:hypothetical protein
MELEKFAETFNITECFDMVYNKQHKGYVFGNIVVSMVDKKGKTFAFSGSSLTKTLQVLQKLNKKQFKLLS